MIVPPLRARRHSSPTEPPPAAAAPDGGPRHADDGAVSRDQGRQSGLPAVLPDGRFLRAVLRGRRDRQPGARHRADQARQASGRGHPDVRRAGRRAPTTTCSASSALGHRVAVCEQTEDPAEARKRGAKSVVRRDVVRLVTPGTITEERLLDPGRANLLRRGGAAARRPTTHGATASPPSTSRPAAFALSETDAAGLAGRNRPARAARDPRARRDPRRPGPRRRSGARPRGRRDAAAARRPRPGLGRAAAEAAISASRRSTASARSAAPRSRRPARALAYVEQTQLGSAPAAARRRRARRRRGAGRSTRRPAPISN